MLESLFTIDGHTILSTNILFLQELAHVEAHLPNSPHLQFKLVTQFGQILSKVGSRTFHIILLGSSLVIVW